MMGGAAGTRTPYLNTASVALSRMSYSPMTARSTQPVRLVACYRRQPGDRYCLHDRGSRTSSTAYAASHQPAARWRSVYYFRSSPYSAQDHACAPANCNSHVTYRQSARHQHHAATSLAIAHVHMHGNPQFRSDSGNRREQHVMFQTARKTESGTTVRVLDIARLTTRYIVKRYGTISESAMREVEDQLRTVMERYRK